MGWLEREIGGAAFASLVSETPSVAIIWMGVKA